MKIQALIILLFSVMGSHVTVAQNLKDLKSLAPVVGSGTSITQDEAAKGLKEALSKGVEKGVEQVSKPDGFLKDPEIKIPLPEEAEIVESKLRKVGQDALVDDVIESMNRAAEDASGEAKAIFLTAINEMTMSDALDILGGGNNAATGFLEKTTRDELFAKFKPVVTGSLDEVGATKYWTTMMSTYNKIPFVKTVDSDLETYVTNKAIDGLFVQVAKAEVDIRTNPAARTSDILKKVFE